MNAPQPLAIGVGIDLSLIFLFVLVLAWLPSRAPSALAAPNVPQPSLFGMNLYITGAERSEEEARALADKARQIGVAWSREEISWATWGDAALGAELMP